MGVRCRSPSWRIHTANRDMEDKKEDNYTSEISSQGQEDEDCVNGGWVTVTTNNVKEVTWPPSKSQQIVSSVKTLPNLSGTVHMGQARRKMLDAEFENVVKTSAHYHSHPFTKGGFQPTKLNADQKWSKTVSKHLTSTQANSDLENKPKQMLKDADDIMNQNQLASVRSSYRMPPGTSRTKKFHESYMNVT